MFFDVREFERLLEFRDILNSVPLNRIQFFWGDAPFRIEQRLIDDFAKTGLPNAFFVENHLAGSVPNDANPSSVVAINIRGELRTADEHDDGAALTGGIEEQDVQKVEYRKQPFSLESLEFALDLRKEANDLQVADHKFEYYGIPVEIDPNLALQFNRLGLNNTDLLGAVIAAIREVPAGSITGTDCVYVIEDQEIGPNKTKTVARVVKR